jgi:hypothetical protein
VGREPAASLAYGAGLPRAFRGPGRPAHWADLAHRWHRLGDPYPRGSGDGAQTEAILAGAIAERLRARIRTDARVVRADAREPLSQAVDAGDGPQGTAAARAARAGRRALITCCPRWTPCWTSLPSLAGPRASVTPGRAGRDGTRACTPDAARGEHRR